MLTTVKVQVFACYTVKINKNNLPKKFKWGGDGMEVQWSWICLLNMIFCLQ